MFRSYELFKILGIPVRIHGTFVLFLLLAGFAFSLGEGLLGFLATLLFLTLVFGFVLLHELGHSVVARWHRIPVRHITLYPLGGIASLSAMPRQPRVEFQVAVAGPLVNFVLAGLFFALSLVVPGALCPALVTVNLVLGLFNLLPGFPLDGGRILRAILAMRRPYVEATRIAARVGQVVAVGLGLVGLLSLNFMLVLIAGFVFFTAQAEYLAARFQHHPLNHLLRNLRREHMHTAFDREAPSRFGVAGSQVRVPGDEPSATEADDCVIELGPGGQVLRVTRRMTPSR